MDPPYSTVVYIGHSSSSSSSVAAEAAPKAAVKQAAAKPARKKAAMKPVVVPMYPCSSCSKLSSCPQKRACGTWHDAGSGNVKLVEGDVARVLTGAGTKERLALSALLRLELLKRKSAMRCGGCGVAGLLP